MSTSIAQRLCNWALDAGWRASSKQQEPAERVDMARRLLRRYPHWSSGHRILAEECLDRDDIAQAYAAALCYRHLVFSDQKARAHANLLIGRCYLRRGDWRSALVHLKDGLKDSPHSSPILEELAAAHMLGGNYSEARNILEQVDGRVLSAQAKAALAFARSKDKQAVE